MAIDLHKMFADALLELCEKKPLKTITVKQLLERTGASKQTFYNRFRDMADLIIWIYEENVVCSFRDAHLECPYYDCALAYYNNIKKYHRFMKQACAQQGQNCLRDYMIERAIAYDLAWLKAGKGDAALSDAIIFASKYNAIANMGIATEWIMKDMPETPEFIAYQTSMMKLLSVGNQAFEDAYNHFDGLKNNG